MRLPRVVVLFFMCSITLSAVGKSGTPQNSQATQPNDIPKSIADGNFIGLAEAMPEDKYSFIPKVASSTASAASGNK
jgi:hypothetical protein